MKMLLHQYFLLDQKTHLPTGKTIIIDIRHLPQKDSKKYPVKSSISTLTKGDNSYGTKKDAQKQDENQIRTSNQYNSSNHTILI